MKRLTKIAAIFALGIFGALSILLALGTPRASAATNNYINFQARLLNSSGTVVPDGNYHIEFKIYNTDGVTGGQGSCSGTCLWMETRSTGNLVKIVNGYFSVSLGSVTAFGAGINWDQQLYLTMRIGGSAGSPSWDGEMQNSSHSIALTGVPYAFRAGTLASFNGTQTGTLSFGAVTNSPVLTLPNETGTLCSTGSVCTGYAPASGSGNYVQLQGSTPGSAQTGNLNISGTGVAGTLQAATFDTASAVALNVGTTNATAINLNQSTTIATGKTLTLASSGSPTTLTSGGNLINAYWNNTSSSGGTINGLQQTINVQDTSSASTTNGINISLVDNSAGNLTNINTGLSISLTGTNNSRSEIGVDITASRGLGLRSVTSSIPGASGTGDCNSVIGVGVGVCAGDTGGSNSGTAVYAYSNSRASANIYDPQGTALYGINNSSGGMAGVFYAGVKGVTTQSNVAASTSMGVFGQAEGGTGATIYGGYFTLDPASGATLGSALYASNSTIAANILQLQDNTTSVVTVADGGASTFENSTNSTTAFQIQNASGNNYLLVNTSGAAVELGNGGIASTIQIGNTTGAVAQTINIGNNSAVGVSASSGPNPPATTADDAAVGTLAWDTPNNAQTSNGVYTYAQNLVGSGSPTAVDNSVKLIKGGVISGTDLADTSTIWPVSEAYASYGSSSNMWGLGLTPSDINSSTFGVAVSANIKYNTTITHYIDATSFGFSIPTGATINGVTADVQKSDFAACFTAGTKILTPSGLKNIEEIQVGEFIIAYDPETQKRREEEVLRVFKHRVKKYVLLKTKNRIVKTTNEHPFLSVDGWKKVSELSIGDKLVTVDGEEEIIGKELIEERTVFPVYNLEVAELHTYIADGFVVHNKPGATESAKIDFIRITVYYTGSPSTNTLVMGSTTGTSATTIESGSGTLAIGNGATAHTIAIGSGAAIQGVTVGSSNSTSTLLLQGGSGAAAVQIQSQGTLSIGNNAVAQTINIGNGTSTTAVAVSCGTGTCGFGNNAIDHSTTLGSITGTSVTTLQGGTGGIAIGTGNVANTIAIGTATAGTSDTVNINNTTNAGAIAMGAGMTTGTITIGGTAQTGTMTLGSSSGTNNVYIANGAGATTVNIANIQNAGGVNIGAGMTTGTITIGGTGAQTGTITLGGGTGAQTVNLATGGTGVKTVHIADSAVANVITLGSTTGAASTTIQSGTGNINLSPAGATGGVVVKPGTDNTTAFQIQNAAGTTVLFSANTVGTGSVPTSPGVAAGANSGGSLLGSGSTTYYYKVSAIVGGIETPASSEVSIVGSSFTPLSSPAAANTPTVGSIGPVVCDGIAGQSCKYEVTFVTANGETTAGAATAGSAIAYNNKINLTGIPTGPAGTIARNVYRSTNGNAYALVNSGTCVLADNVTTSCQDNVASPSGAPPVSNTAQTNLNNATVSFGTVPNATGYRVYRGTTSGGENAYQATASSPFTDTGTAGTSYLPNTDTNYYSSRLQLGSQSVLFKPVTDSTTAFQVQKASATDTLFTANTTSNRIQIGNSTGTDTATTLLVLDGATADPATNVAEGAMYFNSSTHKYRCYSNSAWADCGSAGNAVLVTKTVTAAANQYDVVVIDTANANQVTTTSTLGNARAYGIATATQSAGQSQQIVTAGDYTVNVDTAAVSIGDFLITSSTTGMATPSSNPSIGTVIGRAMSSKAAGSNGTVTIQVTPGVGGSSTTGGMTKLYDTTLGASASSFDVQNIPSGYDSLQVVVYARTDFASPNDNARMRFNNDSAANYLSESSYAGGAGATTQTESLTATSIGGSGAYVTGGTSPANLFGTITYNIPNYANTANNKDVTWTGHASQNTTTGNVLSESGGGTWRSNSAINRVTLLPGGSSNFVAGSRVMVYGIGPNSGGGGSSPSSAMQMAKMHRAAAQGIPFATPTKIDFDAQDYDIGNMSSTSTDKFTANKAGKYLVTASLRIDGFTTSGEYLYAYIYKNGSKVASRFSQTGGATYLNATTTTTLDLAVNDYIEFYTYQSHNATLNTATAADEVPEMSVVEVDSSSSGSATTLQGAYDMGRSITTTDARDINFTLADTATDSNYVINIASGSTGKFELQGAGTNTFTIDGTGQTLFKPTSNTATAFQIQPAASSTPVFDVDTTNGRVGIGTSAPAALLEVAGDVATIRISDNVTKQPQIDLIRGTGAYGSDAYRDWRIQNAGGNFQIAEASTNAPDLGGVALTIEPTTGMVGIGTVSPEALLNVNAGNIEQSGAGGFIKKSAVGGNAQWVLNTAALNAYTDLYNSSVAIKVHLETSGNSYLTGGNLCIGNTNCTHALGVTGAGVASSGFSTGTPDVAEYIDASPSVAATDVVIADPAKAESVTTTSTPYDPAILGVISDGTSGFTMLNAHYGQQFDANADTPDSGAKPMTIAGRVPVKVTGENGAIQPGDYLTTSSTAGYAMKATHAGATIGKALGFFNGTSLSDQGTVLVLVNLSYYGGTGSTTADWQGGDPTVNNMIITGELKVDKLTVSGDAQFKGNVTIAGNTTIQGNLVLAAHIITQGNAPEVTVGENAGTGATVAIDGNDQSGTITIQTGKAIAGQQDSKDPSTGQLIQIQFHTAYAKAPRISLTPANDKAATLQYYYDADTQSFEIKTNTVPAANTTYQYTYLIMQ